MWWKKDSSSSGTLRVAHLKKCSRKLSNMYSNSTWLKYEKIRLLDLNLFLSPNTAPWNSSTCTRDFLMRVANNFCGSQKMLRSLAEYVYHPYASRLHRSFTRQFDPVEDAHNPRASLHKAGGCTLQLQFIYAVSELFDLALLTAVLQWWIHSLIYVA